MKAHPFLPLTIALFCGSLFASEKAPNKAITPKKDKIPVEHNEQPSDEQRDMLNFYYESRDVTIDTILEKSDLLERINYLSKEDLVNPETKIEIDPIAPTGYRVYVTTVTTKNEKRAYTIFLNRDLSFSIDAYTIIEKSDLLDHINFLSRDSFFCPLTKIEITKFESGYSVHLGPHDPYKGGSGVCIFLNPDFSFESYHQETYAPAPSFDELPDEGD